MIGRALRDGVRSATRQPGLVAFLWAWNLALALLVTVPFSRWVSGVSAVSPGTDVLLDGFDLGLVSQLVAADRTVAPVLVATVGALIVLSLVSGALLSGGILEVVAAVDDRQLLHRFFSGGGRFFARFLRLLVIGGISLFACTGVAAAGLSAAARALVPAGNEALSFWTSLAVPPVVGLVAAFFLVALDYARVLAFLGDERRMLRTWWRALRFVVRRTPGAAGIALAAAIVVVGAVAAGVAVDRSFADRSWVAIGIVVAVQQAMVLVRTAARVGQWSAEASYARGLLPAVAVPVEPVASPEPDAVAGKDSQAAIETVGDGGEPG